MPLGLCAFAFVACYFSTKRSLALGLTVWLVFGYLYGIIRANIQDVTMHFLFDVATMGLYVGLQGKGLTREQLARSEWIRKWLRPLVLWPVLVALVPLQPYLVQLVGLRGNVYFLFVILIGSMLTYREVRILALCIAILNLAELGVTLAEYRLGLEVFFPRSPVTDLIYRSFDVAGGFYRLPATFSNSATYGGTMMLSLPFLLMIWNNKKESAYVRLLMSAAILGSTAGVFLSASRSCFVALVLVVATFLWQVRGRATMVGLLILLTLVGIVVSQNERLQRFETLDDKDYITERVEGSVNESFLEAMGRYPLGHGMGGGGTSMPYFLESQIIDPVHIENEYGRILLEQGIPGLMLWIVFVLGAVTKPIVEPDASTRVGKILVRTYLLFMVVTSTIGMGLFTVIPPMPFLLLGWFVGGRSEVNIAGRGPINPAWQRSTQTSSGRETLALQGAK